MKQKELIQKIEELKSIKLDNTWKQENRAILLNQISSSDSSQKVNVFVAVKDFFAQPSFAVVFVLALLIISSVFGVRAVKLRPGDSLYIAQIVSEKTQLAMTFNEGKKQRLEMKFANERAGLIAQLLAEASLGDEKTDNSVKLSADFKKEINIVKEKIQEIKLAEEDKLVFVAGSDLGKDENGLEISDSRELRPEEPVVSEIEPIEAEITSTSTEMNTSSSTEEQIVGESSNLDDTHKKLEEAEELFEQQDYDGVFDKLEEVNVLLSEAEETEDFSESATSTEE